MTIGWARQTQLGGIEIHHGAHLHLKALGDSTHQDEAIEATMTVHSPVSPQVPPRRVRAAALGSMFRRRGMELEALLLLAACTFSGQSASHDHRPLRYSKAVNARTRQGNLAITEKIALLLSAGPGKSTVSHGQVEVLADHLKLRNICKRHSECNKDSFCRAGNECMSCPCTENGVSIDGRCPVDCASARTDPDVDPPELGWAIVDNRGSPPGNVVRLEKGAMSWVDMYMYVTDIGTGLSAAVLIFSSTTASGETAFIKTMANTQSMTMGTPKNGVLKASFWFLSTDEPGRWGLRRLQLLDQAGNSRTYNDRDLLLFGSKCNSTLEVFGDPSRYVLCKNAKDMKCVETARCFDQCHKNDSTSTRCFGKCSCEPGYSGNEFECMATDELVSNLKNGTKPKGIIAFAAGACLCAYINKCTNIHLFSHIHAIIQHTNNKSTCQHKERRTKTNVFLHCHFVSRWWYERKRRHHW